MSVELSGAILSISPNSVFKLDNGLNIQAIFHTTRFFLHKVALQMLNVGRDMATVYLYLFFFFKQHSTFFPQQFRKLIEMKLNNTAI